MAGSGIHDENHGSVGLKDVARVAGVSARTVSRVMRGETNVAPETRDRIRELAREMGYRPNLAARNLRSRRSHEVVLVAWSTVVFNDAAEMFLRRIEGLENRLREADLPLKVRIVPAEPDADSLSRTILDDLVLQQPLGVATFSCPEPLLRKCHDVLAPAGIPLVVMDQPEEQLPEGVANVRVERRLGVREAVAHLARQGRERIAYVGIDTPSRMVGYLEAMAELGREPLTCFTSIVHTSPLLFELGRETVARVLAMEPRPDAIQAYTDSLALGLLDGLKAAGVRVPEEMALIGFDNRGSTMLCHPHLTTVAHPNVEIGQAAAEILLGHIGGQTEPAGGWSRTMPMRLIVRDSA